MKKNIWEKIANQYNIPLEREFIIDEYGAGAIYKFTKNGLVRTDREELPSLTILVQIFNGELSIVPKPWKPEVDDIYWVANETSEGALFTEFYTWRGDMVDFSNYYCGNCFNTQEEAQAQSFEVLCKLQKYYNEKED